MAVDFGQLVLGPCIGIFGEAPNVLPLYQSVGGISFGVNGVFDQQYRPIDPLTIEGMEASNVTTSKPCLGVRLGDFPVPPDQGDLVTIRGIQYRVFEVHPDGVGGARLMLNLA